MTVKNLESVLAIEKEAFPSPWTRALFLQELDLAFSRHLVMINMDETGKKEIVGYIVFWVIHDELQLQRIAVRKDARGQGIGSLLLKEMIRICSRESVVTGSLEVRSGNTSALNLYRKYGFQVVGVRKGYYTDTKEDALIMELRIS